jgi:nitrate reductase gamma subunit
MDWWIDFAKGPLFAVTFLIMILGLGRHVVIQIYSLFVSKGSRLKNAPWRKFFSELAEWVVPVGHLIRGTAFFSIASFIFHVGIILLAVFLIDHIVLWESLTGWDLPAIGRTVADYLTLITMACIAILFFCRIFIRRLRAMSTKSDYLILILVFLPFMFGYMAGHPSVNPFSWEVAMLGHLLSAELLFVIIPFTKLAHIVLYFFDRMSFVHWQLRPGAGDKVAEALFGKEAKV